MYAAIPKYLSALALCFLFVAALTGPCSGQVLYSETFDDGMAVNRWTAFPGVGFDVTGNDPRPIDTNFDTMPYTGVVDGINDTFTGFSFDYSTVGIPPAPHSTGGTTIGLKLQANLFSNALGGFSASPNGLNLTGDYVVRFDHWANTLGPMPAGGSGSTNLSTFGILATGTQSESILSSTGVFFAYTADGESSADYRAYSVEDQNSYNNFDEPHATYHAGTRDTPGATGGAPGAGNSLYNAAFGTGRSVPQTQIDIVGPAGTNEADQRGVINSGAAGFRWNDVEIRKITNSVTWTVNGSLLVTVDLTDFSRPTMGGNISFGHADINATSSQDPAAEKLIFSLVDNIRVDPILVGDYNRNGVVDSADYTIWRDTLGQSGAAAAADGDFNGIVDALDYDLWKANFGNALGSGSMEIASTNATVPEPAAIATLIAGLITLYLRRPTTSCSKLD